MNSNVFYPMKLLWIFLAMILLITSGANSFFFWTNINRYCDRKIQQAIGFEGTVYPTTTSLDMCPHIKHSCCTKQDQLKMYTNWIERNEQEALTNRLKQHRDIYGDLFDKSIEIFERAKKMMMLLHDKSVSNCKVLARRIINFRTDVVTPLLKQSFEDYHEFLINTYKGFYCSVCDAQNTRFINIKTKTITFNEEFCREIVYNSLHVLLYLHEHFTDYLNLLSKFVTSCDYRGVYKKKFVSPKYLFKKKSRNTKMLDNCHRYRNEINWLDFCQPMCKKFSITEMRDFFKPNLAKIKEYSRWIGHRLERHKAGEAKDKLLKREYRTAKREIAKKKKKNKKNKLGEFDVDVNNSRMLSYTKQTRILKEKKKNKDPEEKKNEDCETDEDGKVKKRDSDDKVVEEQETFDEKLKDATTNKETKEIHHPTEESDIEFSVFKSKIDSNGLNPYKIGKMTVITRGAYQTLKTTLIIKKKGQIGYILKRKKKRLAKWIKGEKHIENSDEDLLSSISIMSNVFICLVAVVFMR